VIPILVALSISASPPPTFQDASAAARALPRLAAPFRVLAKDKPITAVVGHTAPFVLDFDGDGKRDLVVGMFGKDPGQKGGMARVYRNLGTNREPVFGEYTTLESDGRPMTMESS
jgi:hypothetical protein